MIDGLLQKLENKTFKAELHDYNWDGQTVDNLLCLGDVISIIEERVNSVVNKLLSEKQHELYGMYNSEMERMIAEDRMERRNEIIDDCVEIVKRGFEM